MTPTYNITNITRCEKHSDNQVYERSKLTQQNVMHISDTDMAPYSRYYHMKTNTVCGLVSQNMPKTEETLAIYTSSNFTDRM